MKSGGQVLLDTHVFVAAAMQPELLPRTVRRICEAPGWDLRVSPASSWEMIHLVRAGKLKMTDPAQAATRFAASLNAIWMPITQADIEAMERLPWLHKDPFDRMLMAQAVNAGIPLATEDALIRKRYARRIALRVVS